MAYSTNSYFSNAIQGIPQVGVDFNIFDKHATPRYAIGTRICRQDGNEYVYSHFGADVNRGVLVSTDVSESSQADIDGEVIASASAQTTTDGTVGSKFVEVNLDVATADFGADITVDQFAGGYFVTTDDAGEGYTYRIKGNTASDDPASQNIRIEFYEPIQVAMTTATDFAIQGSLYANLEIASEDVDNCVAGVTCSTMDVSEQAYGWICVKGVVGILQEGSVAIGDVVVLSGGDDDGAVGLIGGGGTDVDDVTDEEIIGTCLIAGGDTGHGVFKVNIS